MNIEAKSKVEVDIKSVINDMSYKEIKHLAKIHNLAADTADYCYYINNIMRKSNGSFKWVVRDDDKRKWVFDYCSKIDIVHFYSENLETGHKFQIPCDEETIFDLLKFRYEKYHELYDDFKLAVKELIKLNHQKSKEIKND